MFNIDNNIRSFGTDFSVMVKKIKLERDCNKFFGQSQSINTFTHLHNINF